MDIFCIIIYTYIYLYIFLYKKFFSELSVHVTYNKDFQYYTVCTIYTGCPILKIAPKYFFSKAFSEKMFQTKIVWIERGYKKVPLI